MGARAEHDIRTTALDLAGAGRRWHALRLEPARPRHAATLVFLHEALGATTLWRDFPHRLCARLGLAGLVFDRRGHGRSEPLEGPRGLDYLEREALDELPLVLAAAGIARPILVGHSDGGTIALLHAAAFPAEPLAIVTLAAHVVVEPETITGIEAAVRSFETTDLPARLARHHGALTEPLFRAWAARWLAADFRGWNIEHLLPRIICPALVIQGLADQYGTTSQVEAIRRGIGARAQTFLLPGVGHAPHLQATEPVLAAIAAFLEPLLFAVDREAGSP